MNTNIPNYLAKDNKPLIILDEILQYLHDQKEPTEDLIIRGHVNSIIGVKEPLEDKIFHGALNKLYQDRLVFVDHKPSMFPELGNSGYYTLTFEGIFFIRAGGYSGQWDNSRTVENANALIENEQRRQAKQILNLNRWIALATIVAGIYALIEIAKTFGWIEEPIEKIIYYPFSYIC